MVISLEIAVMQWLIAYLNQALPVKEQRVDGYSESRNLDFVRYTLVAGKPVFGEKNPFPSLPPPRALFKTKSFYTFN